MISEPQQRIVDALEGNYLVVAGPGSGKTRTLIERYKNLILNGVKEENILVTTFTNEAVFEIIERLEDMDGIQIHNPVVCTIDKFFYDAVKSVNKKFKVKIGDHENADDGLDNMYEKYFHYINADKTIARKYTNKYKYIMIDEFQDTSELQWLAITKTFEDHKNIMCIGDSNQSIYGWRNAVKSIFDEFRFVYGGEVLYLYENFRCSKNIIKFANHYIKLNYENLVSLPRNELGYPINIIDQNSADVGKYIANAIKFHMEEHGVSFSDIAIISRYSEKDDYGTFTEFDINESLMNNGIYTTRDTIMVNKPLYDEIYNEMVRNIEKVGRIITSSLVKRYPRYITNKVKKLVRHLDRDTVSEVVNINLIYEHLSEVDKIHFISIHNAKGKEYKIVFLLTPMLFPYFNYELNLPAPYDTDGQELVRLNYVGFTRAKEFLYVFHDQYHSEDKFDKIGDNFHEYIEL